MTEFDYGVIFIVGLSMVISVVRGAIREVLSLAGWVAAFLIATGYAAAIAPYMPDAIANPSLRLLSGFVLLFLSTLVVTALLSLALSELVKAVGLSTLDRSVGALFGLGRGLVLVLALVLAGGLTSLPGHPFWRDAALSGPLEDAAAAVKPWLPDGLSKRIRYRQQ